MNSHTEAVMSDPIVSISTSEGPVNVPLSQVLNSAMLSQGLLANLPTLAVGALYFAQDVQIMYVGTAGGNAPTTALPLVGLAADVPTDAPAGFLYFATDTNVLYVALGQGSKLVVPPIVSGTFAEIPVLVEGAFYLTTDTNALYIGTTIGNVLVGPTPAPAALHFERGEAICTGSGPTVNFAANFTATTAPVVIVSQVGTTPNALSASVSINGSAGAWTGFTLHLSGSFFGAYSYIAVGTPN